MREPIVIPNLDDVKDWVGVELGYSDWYAITQECIDAFADATGDHQWLHVDVERAKRESPFGTTIAHGYFTLSLIPQLIDHIGRIEGHSSIINVGFDKVRLKGPVPVGSRVRMSAKIKQARDVLRGGLRVVFDIAFEVEGSPRKACVCEAIFLYLR